MSLNHIKDETISALTVLLLEAFKSEQKSTIANMKDYLNKSDLTEEKKIKLYAEFEKNIFTTKITQCLQTSSSLLVQDAQISEQNKLNQSQISFNNAQIGLINAQKDAITIDNQLKTAQKDLAEQQKRVYAQEEYKLKVQTGLLVLLENAKVGLTHAQILESAKKSGASVSKEAKIFDDKTNGISYPYEQLKLSASAKEEDGLIGAQANQLNKQAKSFADHSKVQVANQLVNIISTALDADVTNVEGMIKSFKTIAESISGVNFDESMNSIGK